MMRFKGAIIWAAVGVGALACGSGIGEPTRTDATLGAPNAGGTDTTGSPATSTGPVASVTLTPKNVTLRMGYYTYFSAAPRDDKGALVTGKRAAWSSSNSAVLVASDTGVFYAKAIGSAKVYGTIDGHTDSANVVVIVAAPDTLITPPPAPVSSFNLALSTAGAVAGADTSQSQPVAGVTITVTRVGGVRGDTLNAPIVAGTVTTDANGTASLQNLPGGSYSFAVTPPAGSPFVAMTWGIPAPTIGNVAVRIVLRRAP
jgi:Prealbumin-like fold domain/Bacterial Ig-like domain (group 2)